MTYEAFDVVVVPFPFTDRKASKRRPAVVLSSAGLFNTPAGHSMLAMITSKGHVPWPLDVGLADLRAAGLSAPSIVRFKLFTLDNSLILRKAGKLAAPDRGQVRTGLRRLLPA